MKTASASSSLPCSRRSMPRLISVSASASSGAANARPAPALDGGEREQRRERERSRERPSEPSDDRRRSSARRAPMLPQWRIGAPFGERLARASASGATRGRRRRCGVAAARIGCFTALPRILPADIEPRRHRRRRGRRGGLRCAGLRRCPPSAFARGGSARGLRVRLGLRACSLGPRLASASLSAVPAGVAAAVLARAQRRRRAKRPPSTPAASSSRAPRQADDHHGRGHRHDDRRDHAASRTSATRRASALPVRRLAPRHVGRDERRARSLAARRAPEPAEAFVDPASARARRSSSEGSAAASSRRQASRS